jgi:GT2 family glycosyltransferase
MSNGIAAGMAAVPLLSWRREIMMTDGSAIERERPTGPFVSIVIPTFNRAEKVCRAVESCLVQDDRDLEVIVVDDGSSDGTRDAIASITDARVRYEWKENEERAIARNRGVALARGRYVYFLDSDDVITPDHVSHGRAYVARHGCPELLHSRFERRSEGDGASEFARYPRSPERVLPRRNFVGSYLWVRRDVALEHPFVADRTFNLGEDWYLALVLAARYPLHVTERATRIVHMHGGQSMGSSPDLFERNRARILEHLAKDDLVVGRFPGVLRTVGAEMDSLIALQAALRGDARRAIAHQARAIAARPSLALERRTFAVAHRALRGWIAAKTSRVEGKA